MISKSEVVGNLTRLEQLFDNSLLKPTTYHEANYFGKLAVMEASAWLEECVENIYEELASLHLTVEANKKSYKTIIKKNHGFNYDEYLRNKLACNVIGLVHIEKMELALGSREEFQYMKAALNSLTTLRGDLAHNHLKGTILSVQTVKETIKLFNDAVGGLKIMETYLRKIKFK